jgi:hypothetical protein
MTPGPCAALRSVSNPARSHPSALMLKLGGKRSSCRRRFVINFAVSLNLVVLAFQTRLWKADARCPHSPIPKRVRTQYLKPKFSTPTLGGDPTVCLRQSRRRAAVDWPLVCDVVQLGLRRSAPSPSHQLPPPRSIGKSETPKRTPAGWDVGKSAIVSRAILGLAILPAPAATLRAPCVNLTPLRKSYPYWGAATLANLPRDPGTLRPAVALIDELECLCARGKE